LKRIIEKKLRVKLEMKVFLKYFKKKIPTYSMEIINQDIGRPITQFSTWHAIKQVAF
jgi:hypothetical protein